MVRNKVTADKKAAFLAALAETYTVTHAADAAGISRKTAYEWRKEDGDFAAAWDAAQERAVDALEQSVYQKAMAGDVTLSIFMLKGMRPVKYRDNARIEHSGPGGGAIPLAVAGLPEDALRKLVAEAAEGQKSTVQ